MKLNYKKVSLSTFVFMLFMPSLFSQSSQLFWSKVSKEKISKNKSSKASEPTKADYYTLDISKLKAVLKKAPNRNITKGASSIVLEFPNSEGHFEAFTIKEASILEPAYQKEYPNIRSYVGQSVKNPSTSIRFSITSNKLHSMLISPKKGTQFIDPFDKDNTYIVYKRNDVPSSKKGFECYFDNFNTDAGKIKEHSKILLNANDGQFRTFRLALAGTAEYSQYHWSKDLQASATDAEKKAKVLEAMVETMTRVNAIYERELSLTMVLVNNSSIIFLDAATDGYTNSSPGSMLDENQTIIDGAIGFNNYDIGHVFATSGGGVAFLRSPCTNLKAKGVSGGGSSPDPTLGYIDLIAHEMGHQYGSPHTFNGSSGNCGPNRSANSAYEPGSGSTIMSYAGICGPQNIQNIGDPYFHQHSLRLMWDNISTGRSNCASLSTITNNAPTANAGPDYTIPISTAYKLVGSSTDPDGTSTHTYTWEQYDLGPAGAPTETTQEGPLVRSYQGTNNPIRYIPSFPDYVASGGSTQWEKLVSINREINFALTVRDNSSNGAQNAVDFMKVIVNSTDPFTVKTPLLWSAGSEQTIEWEVGQTSNVSTINCQSVNIKLSTDGGLTFPTTIASNTPNNGSFTYTVSNALPQTTNARILVEAADNIFYDICDNNFEIIASPSPDFFIVQETLEPIDCGETTATYTFEYVTVNSFSENTVFSASGIPGNNSNVTFSPTSLSASGSVTMTISNLSNVDKGDYPITITGTSASKTKDLNTTLPFYKGVCRSTGNTQFNTSTTLVNFNDINQSSGKTSGYSDFSNTASTNVNRGNSYDLTINVNTDGSVSTLTKVWIDWNQNCSFNDPGEEYNLGTANSVSNGATENSPLSITIPDNAVLGSTLMRVNTKWDGQGDPVLCENGFDGEIEDYTLNIQATLAVEEFGFDNFLMYPNPNNGEFTIKLNGSLSSDVNVEIYDLRGRTIYKKQYKDVGDFKEKIDLNHVQSGMYILNVSDGLRKSTEKIIIE